jgi:AefR-like transcriptional repressor, C-terminal domain
LADASRACAAFVQALCAPNRQSPIRAVIAMGAYLAAQVAAGRLVIPDCEVAAAQFMESSQATLFKPLLFNAAPPPSPERIEYVVGIAVKAFIAAYDKEK